MIGRAQKLLALSPWVVSLGVVTLLAGLGWDAVLHNLDPDLAAREGIVTLTNPGHVLFGGGIAIIVTGALMYFAAKALTAPRPLVYALPAVTMAGLATVSFALAASSGTLGGPKHEHAEGVTHLHDDGTAHTDEEHRAFEAQPHTHENEAAHTHSPFQQPAAPQAGSTGASAPAGVVHDHGESVAVTAAELEAAARLVADTRTGAARFEDMAAALSEGYYQVAPPRNGIAHYLNARYTRDGRILDPERPESLMYLRLADGSWKLVGALYRMPSPDQPGPRIGGPLTTWHAHDNLCTANGRVVGTTNTGVCTNGTASRTPEMLHVWLVSNPDGVFSDDMEPAAVGELLQSLASR